MHGNFHPRSRWRGNFQLDPRRSRAKVPDHVKRRRILRMTGMAMAGVMIPLGLLACFQDRLIYLPRSYASGETEQWARETGGRTLEARTSQGRQRAYLQGNVSSPRNLWIVCGGNGTLALEWSEWIALHAPAVDAWLLVDFPGYGDSEGRPNPERIRENFRALVPLAIEELGWTPAEAAPRLRVFGHSLGAAACLIAANEFGIRQGVLLAPFTSTMDMSRAVFGVPLGFIVHHRFDNSERLRALAADEGFGFTILHGTDDEVIPVGMSRRLAEVSSGIELREIPGGRHNTLPLDHAKAIARALRERGAAK